MNKAFFLAHLFAACSALRLNDSRQDIMKPESAMNIPMVHGEPSQPTSIPSFFLIAEEDSLCAETHSVFGSDVFARPCSGRSKFFITHTNEIINEVGKCLQRDIVQDVVFMRNCHGGKDQKWLFTVEEKLISAHDGKCLDIGEELEGERRLIVTNCTKGRKSQSWDTAIPSIFVSHKDNLCISENKWDSKLFLEKCTGEDIQTFYLTPSHQLKVARVDSLCLEATTSGRMMKLEMRPCTSAIKQKWVLDGSNIKMMNGSGCIQNNDGNQLALAPCNEDSDQAWLQTSLLELASHTEFGTVCVDFYVASGRGYVLSCDGARSQRFYWTPSGKFQSASKNPRHANWCLDGNREDGLVFMQECTNGTDQSWRMYGTQLQSRGSGKCLTFDMRSREVSMSDCSETSTSWDLAERIPSVDTCFESFDSERALTEAQRGNLSHSECQFRCGQLGYRYFGSTNETECFCGIRSPRTNHARMSQCNVPCGANGWEQCGGANAMRVGRSSTVDLCFDGIALSDFLASEVSYSECNKLCFEKGYQYFGSSNETQCYCGHEKPFQKQLPINECAIECPSNTKEACGKTGRTLFGVAFTL